jgi:hypothetical protein
MWLVTASGPKAGLWSGWIVIPLADQQTGIPCAESDMNMNLLAGIVVVAFGLFLVGVAGTVFARRAFAERFLMSFASSARAHYVEQALRLLIGASLIVFSPAMWQPDLFRFIGWAIVISSLGLLLVPWRWHHRLGERVRPVLLRHMRLYALGLFAFGALLLYGVVSAA